MIVYTFDSFLLQSDGKQGRDEQVGQYLTNRRNEIDNNEEEENYDDINICSQVSLNLNDISSHTKQMGETSRLVQQVMMISKCHPKVQIIGIGFILDSDSEHFYSGAGSPQRPLGW